HTEQFNHHPGQLMMQCGRGTFGLPTMGSWLNYGLGSVSKNLPGYVVLNSGRGSSGGATLWQSGFLPSTYSGVLFRNQGEPVLNLTSPPGIPAELQRAGLDAVRDANQQRYAEVHDPEIAARIASYELAFRMQAAAPELIDALDRIRDSYNVNGLGQVGALATLKSLGHYRKNFKRIKAIRGRTAQELESLGFEVLPSATNFLFVRPPGPSAKTWQRKLRDQKIIVRWFTASEVCDYLRITIGTDKEMEACLQAVRKILK
ncbi:MAG: aminotransferase class I/II-fold pyridoxal phosphate-dependent enzyme, partial [Limisphaerales bacterium]